MGQTQLKAISAKTQSGVTLTVRQLLSLPPALAKIGEHAVASPYKFHIGRQLRKLRAEIDTATEQYLKIYRKYGTEQPNGTISLQPNPECACEGVGGVSHQDGSRTNCPDCAKGKAASELDLLYAETAYVDVVPFTEKALSELPLDANTIAALDKCGLLEEEAEEE